MARNELPLGRQEKIEALIKGAELIVERNPRFTSAVRELVEEYGNAGLIPFETCVKTVEKGNFGYEPEMVYAVGKVIERAH